MDGAEFSSFAWRYQSPITYVKGITIMSNSMMDLKKYFETPEKPVTNAEMAEFWRSLTEAEKDYFKNAQLTK